MITTLFDQSYLFDIIRFQANEINFEYKKTGYKPYKCCISNKSSYHKNAITNMKTHGKNKFNRKGKI